MSAPIPAPLPADWDEKKDLAECWAELLRIERARLLAGEPLHPDWLPKREREERW